MTSLPGVLGVIEEVAGRDKALEAALKLGGQYVTLNERTTARNKLTALIGADAMHELRERLPLYTFVMPKGPTTRAKRCQQLLRRGWKHRDIAAQCGLNVRTVEYHAQQLRQRGQLPAKGAPSTGQLDLFGQPENLRE